MNRLLQHKLSESKKNSTGISQWNRPETYLWTLNPLVHTLLWFAALVWGACASFFTKAILTFHFPGFTHLLEYEPNWATIVFAASGFVLVFLFALSSWVSRRQNSIVIDSMLTMPPHDFWAYYGEQYTKVDALVETTQLALLLDDDEGLSREDKLFNAQESVRVILDSVTNLVKKWDSANLRSSDVVYRANLMTVYRIGDNEEDEIATQSAKYQELLCIAKRFTISPAQSHYSGFVVLLDNVYTTTTESRDPEPDEKRQQLAFPFTEQDAEIKYPINANIMGAPAAVATRSYSYVPDVADIPRDYKQNSNVTDKKIEEALHEFYSDKSVAHSILSIPIMYSDKQKVKWVFNVYRNQDGLLFDGSKVKDFAAIIKPYTSALDRIMVAIDLFEKSA